MSLIIEAAWEHLDVGAPEERACFSALGIRYNDIWLTAAEDAFVGRLRNQVHLSAYRLAEWFAWNWWRLRWEPRARTMDWALAHRMTTIGGGYVWPNVTIFSDGERVVLLARPTGSRPQEPLRYVADLSIILPVNIFVGAVDRFLEQVRGQLQAERLLDTNLDKIWDDVLAERAEPGDTSRRRFEALLGFDPDGADEAVLDALIEDSQALGEPAMNEVAADRPQSGEVITAQHLREVATAHGFDARPRDAVRLTPDTPLSLVGQVPAWRRGAEAARALRAQEQLGAEPLRNSRLAELVGVLPATLVTKEVGPDFAFALDGSAEQEKVVLRSKWETGRRFDLARLLGDRIITSVKGLLFPATHASTYRQKIQRAFAAELLCPFAALEDLLAGDYSAEKLEDAAAHFSVSERVVRTLLVNHGRMEADDLDGDIERAVAAA